jgi:predicted Zn finger-like uncharacterized protein
MKTNCPGCKTHYMLDANALMATDGLARCHRCGTVFDAVGERAMEAPPSAEPLQLDEQAETDWQTQQSIAAVDLPFDVPDDLEPLQPSPDAALDVEETLYQRPSRRGALYAGLALLLALGLGLQLAWQYREALLARFPGLQPVCDRLACVATQVHAPAELRVLQRELRAADNQPDSLNLSARFRNDADAAQPLPDIQLSLLDNNGSVLIRRRLSPHEYLFPPPPTGRVIAPGEVITISIDFKDPGYLATGFMLDFL